VPTFGAGTHARTAGTAKTTWKLFWFEGDVAGPGAPCGASTDDRNATSAKMPTANAEIGGG